MPTWGFKNLHNWPLIEILFPADVNIFITKSQTDNTVSQQVYTETVKKAQVIMIPKNQIEIMLQFT